MNNTWTAPYRCMDCGSIALEVITRQDMGALAFPDCPECGSHAYALVGPISS